jgi:predicted RecB family nuclease
LPKSIAVSDPNTSTEMNITADLFEAYLKCPTKCFFRSRREVGVGNTYADWVRTQTDAYRNDHIKELKTIAARDGRTITTPLSENLKAAERGYAFDFVARAQNLESHIHMVESVAPEESSKPVRFVPIRFVFTNKINKNDKLLLAFDALVLSEVVGREIGFGKIIHGDDHSTINVKISALMSEVQKLISKITTLISDESPPDLVLNRHCVECEFKVRCRQKAIEADDLSLLSAMTEKERSRHRSKGIFTVNQLSYTFRPRKTPKRAKRPAKPHYLALQALSIRENTVYVHGYPQLPASESKVFLDIEGLPDGEFYYLIGALFVINGQETFHSFWADNALDEAKIFTQFVDTVCQLPEFDIFHFGSYETIALRRAKQKLPDFLKPKIDLILGRSANVLSVVYPYVYFPTYSNGLKEIGRFLGHPRVHEDATGLETIAWRKNWETDKDLGLKSKLMQYNYDDCVQLKRLCEFVARLNSPEFTNSTEDLSLPKLSRTEELKKDRPRWEKFGPREYVLSDFKHVVQCSYFDYQREKVFIRTHQHFKTINKRHRKLGRTNTRPNRVVTLCCERCPRCGKKMIEKKKGMSHDLIDLKFSKSGVKKWITRFDAWQYQCLKCNQRFSSEKRTPNPQKYGHGLLSWCVYINSVCGVNVYRILRTLGDVFGVFIYDQVLYRLKHTLAQNYQSLSDEIHQSVLGDPVLHVDETVVHLRGGLTGYVWVLTSMDKVYYFYRPSREASFLREVLAPFKGVLVSDFYPAYDSLECSQQKCLVHFVRDIDEDLLTNSLDIELKTIAAEFGTILRAIIQTVDRYGLKSRHLKKHKKIVSRFLHSMASNDFVSETANKYKKRFQKSGAKMFTFLDHDGVPWNNNNAEHAIKRFAKYRRDADGRFTERTLTQYLVLATVFETCEFNNVNILKFLLSKETTLAGLFKMARRKVDATLHNAKNALLPRSDAQTESSESFN